MGARGRSTRTDGERTRARILEVALPLFAAHGFAGTSIRQVAGAAEVNVATLAYHFSDKQGLYNTAVQRLYEDLTRDFPAQLPRLPPSEQIAWLVERSWDFAMSHQLHMRLLVRHVLDEKSHPAVVVDRWTEPLLVRAEELVGAFRPSWSRAQRRLLVLAASHLVVRFALEDREQLAALVGRPDDLDHEMRRFLGDFLQRELGLGA